MTILSATGSPAPIPENTGEPLVSVIIIFLDAARFIEEAIDSVMVQTYDHWELLLVDDGSTDGSTEIAKVWLNRFPDKVRYFEHDGHNNRGMSAMRNLGISQAQGKYIAFLDADDVWLPGKLERRVAILESQPETAMIYGPAEYWYSWSDKSEDYSRDHVPDLCVKVDIVIEPPALLILLYPLGPGTAPPPSSIVVRSDVVKKLGGFEESVPNYYDDQGFLTKVYLSEKVFVSSECLERYRIHADSWCSVVERAGLEESQYKTFLIWLCQFLRSRDVRDAEIWNALDDATRNCEYRASKHANDWSLRIANGNMARLALSADAPDRIRIHVTRSLSDQTFDTQLNSTPFAVQAHQRYSLAFSAELTRRGRFPLDWQKTIPLGIILDYTTRLA